MNNDVQLPNETDLSISLRPQSSQDVVVLMLRALKKPLCSSQWNKTLVLRELIDGHDSFCLVLIVFGAVQCYDVLFIIIFPCTYL